MAISFRSAILVAILVVLLVLSIMVVTANAKVPHRPGGGSASQRERDLREQVDRARQAHKVRLEKYASDGDPRFRPSSSTGRRIRNQLNQGDNEFDEQEVYIRQRRTRPSDDQYHNDGDDGDYVQRSWKEQRARYARADMPHLDSLINTGVPGSQNRRHHRRPFDGHRAPSFVENYDNDDNYMESEMSSRIARLSERFRQQHHYQKQNRHRPSVSVDEELYDNAERQYQYRRPVEPVDTEALMQEMQDRQDYLRQQREHFQNQMKERFERLIRTKDSEENTSPAEHAHPTQTNITPAATAEQPSSAEAIPIPDTDPVVNTVKPDTVAPQAQQEEKPQGPPTAVDAAAEKPLVKEEPLTETEPLEAKPPGAQEPEPNVVTRPIIARPVITPDLANANIDDVITVEDVDDIKGVEPLTDNDQTAQVAPQAKTIESIADPQKESA